MEKRRFRDTHYWVYSDGRVWSERFGGCFKRFNDNGVGYLNTSISIGEKGNKKAVKFYIHRMVAECFIPNPEGKAQVNHKNGNKWDNRVENLEWCSGRENMNHAIFTGLVKINIEEWAKEKRVIRGNVFSNEEANRMREMRCSGVSVVDIGKEYGISNCHVVDITDGKLGHLLTGYTFGEMIKRRVYVKEMELEWKREMLWVKRGIAFNNKARRREVWDKILKDRVVKDEFKVVDLEDEENRRRANLICEWSQEVDIKFID